MSIDRRSFFQRIACAVIGVVTAVYAPGLLREPPHGGYAYWFETRFRLTPRGASVIWTSHEHRKGLLEFLNGVSEARGTK